MSKDEKYKYQDNGPTDDGLGNGSDDFSSRSAGRILRVKHGYNPNSSSLGSIVFALPSALLGAGVAFGAVAGLIYSAYVRPAEETDDEEPATEEKDEPPRASGTTDDGGPES